MTNPAYSNPTNQARALKGPGKSFDADPQKQ